MGQEFRDSLTKALIDSIAETQQRSGRELQVVTKDTIPLTDLANFDSLSGVEVEVLLSNRLGFEIEEIPFREGRHGSRELPVSEIVDALIKKYGAAIPKALKNSGEQLVTN